MGEEEKKPEDTGVRDKHRDYYERRALRRRKQLFIGSILLFFVVSLTVFGAFKFFSNDKTGTPEGSGTSRTEYVKDGRGKDEYVEATLIAAGDNLIHNTIYTQAQARAGGSGYDFSPVYAGIAPMVAKADIVFINQETPVASKVLEVSSYPMFNTPVESVEALAAVGFNAFNLASNHTLDKGEKGMRATLDFMGTLPNIVHFGAYRNEEDLNTAHTIEKNGIVFSFIGITEMTNGMSLPDNSELRLVYASQTEEIREMLATAKANADVVVASVHWGDENQLEAAERQKELARQLTEWGADIIIGHHPHVLQQIEVLTRSDGTEVPVIYSLGNFVSSQRGKANMVGGFFGCTVKKNLKDDAIEVTDIAFTPTITQFSSGYGNVHVVPYDENYTEAMAASHGLSLSLDYINDLLLKTVGEAYLPDFIKAAGGT